MQKKKEKNKAALLKYPYVWLKMIKHWPAVFYSSLKIE